VKTDSIPDPKIVCREVGRRVLLLREAADMTLDVLSDRSGVSKGNISQIERDPEANPTVQTLAKIAQGLQVPVAFFFEPHAVATVPVSVVSRRLKKKALELAQAAQAFAEEMPK